MFKREEEERMCFDDDLVKERRRGIQDPTDAGPAWSIVNLRFHSHKRCSTYLHRDSRHQVINPSAGKWRNSRLEVLSSGGTLSN